MLDCGCGPGGLAEQLARHEPARLLAVDANPGMVRQARHRLDAVSSSVGIEVRRAFVDADFFAELDEDFDVICFKRSLYATPEAALATVRGAVDVLAPGGVVIVAQPERRLRRYAFGPLPPYLQPHSAFHLVNRLLSRIAVALGVSDYRDMTHEELVELLRSAAPNGRATVLPSEQWAYALAAVGKVSPEVTTTIVV